MRHLVANTPVTAPDARPLPYVPGPALLDEVLAVMRRSRTEGGHDARETRSRAVPRHGTAALTPVLSSRGSTPAWSAA